nr:MAG TPA: hypothetical protein [Caudoviricetes sp.]
MACSSHMYTDNKDNHEKLLVDIRHLRSRSSNTWNCSNNY